MIYHIKYYECYMRNYNTGKLDKIMLSAETVEYIITVCDDDFYEVLSPYIIERDMEVEIDE